MSTIAPDQLPTPSQAPAPIPTPVAPIASFGPAAHAAHAPRVQATAGRSALVRRLTVAGVAGLVVIALGAVGLSLAGGGDGADTRAASTDRDDEREEREDGEEGQGDPFDQGDTPSTGNASVDVDATYSALFGVAPSADVADCIASAAEPVIDDVQAVVNGTATTVDQVTSGLAPFASCVSTADFDGAVFQKASGLVAPSQLDSACASSVLATFTETDRLDVLVTAIADPAQYDQRVYTTFSVCAV